MKEPKKSPEKDIVDWNFEDEFEPNALRSLEDEPREFEFDKNMDPNALKLTLNICTENNEDFVEVYAHGATRSSGSIEVIERTELLARVTEKELTMYPLVAASYRSKFLKPKYDEITSIVILADELRPWPLPASIQEFDDLLAYLPTGFGRHAKYGLGLKWEYRLIPEALLEFTGITRLIIEPGNEAALELPNFKLGIKRFTVIRRAIDSIAKRASSRSLRDRRLAAYNATLAVALPDQFEHRFPKPKPGEIYELVHLRGRDPTRSTQDRAAAAKIVQDDAEKLAAEQPAELLRLRAVIEQVTLKELIGKFEVMLSQNLVEPKWQAFFKANPFILSLAFPYPVILLQDEANVGGTTIRGNGESIVDFLMAQRFTGNLALIEIKRPATGLINSKPYRGDVHAPHTELTASIAQILDQRAQLLHHFAVKKSQDKTLDCTQVSSVNCIVVVGTMPKDQLQTRSLDLFRHSSKDVTVITFDELLEKLKELHRLMCSSTITNTTVSESKSELADEGTMVR